MSSLLLVFLFTMVGPLPAAPSTNGGYVRADRVPARLELLSRDGLSLKYVIYEGAPGSAHPVVIAPGCGESVYRYDAMVADLVARGYGPIYIIEHRSQGFSEGTGVRDDLVHVDRFRGYVTDFLDFMHGPVATDLAARGITVAPDLIAHSMGGAIANLALGDEPTLARHVAYIAPMMDINTSILNPMNDKLALWAARALCAAGFCERLAVGGMNRARKMKIPGVPREVAEGIFRAAVTPGWLRASIPATVAIRRRARAHAEPSLMVVALRDRLVGNPALRTYAAEARNVALLELDGAHGLHHDPRTRRPLVDAIDRFFGGCEDRLMK